MDIWDGIIIGAGAAAVGSILAYVIINRTPIGGGAPRQPAYGATTAFGRSQDVYAVYPELPTNAAPLAQVNPNQEAAFSVQITGFEPGFGPNVSAMAPDPTILPY